MTRHHNKQNEQPKQAHDHDPGCDLSAKLLHEAHEQSVALHRIAQTLHALGVRLFPIPDRLRINLPLGDSAMALPKTYPVGTNLVSLAATEFDTLVTPPAPFTYAKGSVVYTQSGGAGTFIDNTDSTFQYQNTVAEVVTFTATDSVSNPGTTLTDTAVVTFQVAAQLPNSLNIVLP